MSIVLPDYTRDQFDLVKPLECDAIMKGGVTSGIIYPYAILEIATKYRFRSLGGTSAGAIAAAFAAAAEYGRQQGRPEAFLTLKRYSDQLPEILLSLFQPSPAFKPGADLVKQIVVAGGAKGFWDKVAKPAIAALKRRTILIGLGLGLAGALALAVPSALLHAGAYATGLAAVLGFVLAGLGGLAWMLATEARRLYATYAEPAVAMWQALPQNNYGVCTGLTQPGNAGPGLTDWLHRALQDIAFGDPDHAKPLTFGDLWGADPAKPVVDLKVVTTNLSMRRPHTLPKLGVPSGFEVEQWQKIFPAPIMDYLAAITRPWKLYPAAQLFPREAAVPVLVAVRMSLSFPLLFSGVPLKIGDTELPAIVRSLGGKPYKRVRTAYFSDGGISSNFPIHMFDAILPTRPTFAFSIEDLLWDPKEVVRRVTIPHSAAGGMGVQIKKIENVKTFAEQILASSKDWQDQLLSEITGQRERIARIFLADGEGGLNLNMTQDASRQLMLWGHEAGKAFTQGPFSFDEHRWRRLLVLYRHLRQSLTAADTIWSGGFGAWYQGYQGQVKSYKTLSAAKKQQIAHDLEEIFAVARALETRTPFASMDKGLPQKSGVLKVGPKF